MMHCSPPERSFSATSARWKASMGMLPLAGPSGWRGGATMPSSGRISTTRNTRTFLIACSPGLMCRSPKAHAPVLYQRPSRITWKAVSSSNPVKVSESKPRIYSAVSFLSFSKTGAYSLLETFMSITHSSMFPSKFRISSRTFAGSWARISKRVMAGWVVLQFRMILNPIYNNCTFLSIPQQQY